MDNKDIMSIYDRLCLALCTYETGDGNDDGEDAGKLLYAMLVDIVSDFAVMLN